MARIGLTHSKIALDRSITAALALLCQKDAAIIHDALRTQVNDPDKLVSYFTTQSADRCPVANRAVI